MRILLSRQEVNFLKQLDAAGDNGRVLGAQFSHASMRRLLEAGYALDRAMGPGRVSYRITKQGREALRAAIEQLHGFNAPGTSAPDARAPQEITDVVRRQYQEGKRRRGRGDPGIYTSDIERRIEEGVRERDQRTEVEVKRDKERD